MQANKQAKLPHTNK